MSIIYSHVPPLVLGDKETTIKDQISTYFEESDRVEIAVGYVSADGLSALDQLVRVNHIKEVELVAGMYINSGIPESVHNQVLQVHQGWKRDSLGQIFLVNNMNYHGKTYLFWRKGQLIAGIIGSANLSVLAPTGNTARQYELAMTVDDQQSLQNLHEHIQRLIDTSTTSADDLSDFKILHERIEVLKGYEEVTEISEDEISKYDDIRTDTTFRIPIKVPVDANRFSIQRSDYAQSNLNVAYGKGRKGKNGQLLPRNWYEVQITVNTQICSNPNYPRDLPFWVVTDDGYKFEAHTAGDHYKQLSAYGSDRVFGHWIKGRLATAGYVKAVDNVFEDVDRDGVITREMLDKAQMRVMIMTKTTQRELGRVYSRKAPTARNKKGALDNKHWTEELLDVWTLRFEGINN